MPADLSIPHRFIAGGVSWAVTDAGISIDTRPVRGTDGPPMTVHRVNSWFGKLITDASLQFGVPAEILVAIVCNESAGGQTDRAVVLAARREEPGYISDHVTPDRVSTGCCQTLLSTARWVLKRPELTSGDLVNPAISIQAAAAYIAGRSNVTGLDPVLIAACYNAGGLYREDTVSNRWGLRCFPLHTGQYIDRFVLWYNDAVAVAQANRRLGPDT